MRVAIADDAALFRTGLAHLLDAAGITVTCQASDAEELMTFIAAELPDAVVLDIRMPPSPLDGGRPMDEQLEDAPVRSPGLSQRSASVPSSSPRPALAAEGQAPRHRMTGRAPSKWTSPTNTSD